MGAQGALVLPGTSSTFCAHKGIEDFWSRVIKWHTRGKMNCFSFASAQRFDACSSNSQEAVFPVQKETKARENKLHVIM